MKKTAVSAEPRAKAKTVLYEVLYGMTPFGLANPIVRSVEVSRQGINRLFERYLEIYPYSEGIKRQAIKEGTFRR